MAPPRLAFHDLGLTVKGKDGGPKAIVQAISASIAGRRVVAIMGPSGAGKTTLLSLLTLRAPKGEVSGMAMVDGQPLTSARFRRSCFYVAQGDDESTWPTLTPREQITYATAMFTATACKKGQGAPDVDDLLKRLGLESCADTVAGHAFVRGGLSGGQKRRLAVATALVKRADLIFLDEPTSGLDSASALQTCQTFRDVADDGPVIAMTIHQPSTKIWALLDDLLLMSCGRRAYFGPAAGAVAHFEARGHPFPAQTNPADFLLDLVNADFVDRATVDAILDAAAAEATEATAKAPNVDAGPKVDAADAGEGANPVAGLRPVFRRQAVLVRRDPIYGVRLVCCLVSNLFFCAVFANARERKQNQVTNRLWLMVWLLGVTAQTAVLLSFALNAEARIARNEVSNGMLKPMAYILARGAVDIPLLVLLALLVFSFPFFAIMNGYAKNGRFFTTTVVWMTWIYCNDAFAGVLAVAFENPLIAAAAFVGTWFGGFLFAGLMVKMRDIVWPLKTFHYVFPLGFSIHGLVFSDFIDSHYDRCDKYNSNTICFCPDNTSRGCGGKEVLTTLHTVYQVASEKNQLVVDIFLPLAIAVFLKFMTAIIFAVKSRGTPFAPARVATDK